MTSWIDELLAYVDTFDPGFRGDIAGASAVDIERYEALLGHELPADYRAFLETMGATWGDGGLCFHMDMGFGLPELLEWNEQDFGWYRESVRCIPIGNGLPGECGLHRTADGEWAVVQIDGDGGPGDRMHASLPAMCFHNAFYLELQAGGATVTSRHALTPDQIAALADRLADRGYEQQWFSEDHRRLLRSGDTLIGIGPVARGYVYVGGRTAPAAESGRRDVILAGGPLLTPMEQRPDSPLSLPDVRAYLRRLRAVNG